MSNRKITSKRDKSGDLYRYDTKRYQPKSMATDKPIHRPELKDLLGKEVEVEGLIRYNIEDDRHCSISRINVIYKDDTFQITYAWMKSIGFKKANIPHEATIIFTAKVRMYNSDGKIKYSFAVPKNIKIFANEGGDAICLHTAT